MYSYPVFCVGEDTDRSFGGTLETLIPLKVGHIHRIKGRLWECAYVDKDGRMADFVLARNTSG